MSRAADIDNPASGEPSLASRRVFIQSVVSGILVGAMAQSQRASAGLLGFPGGAPSAGSTPGYFSAYQTSALSPLAIYPRPDTETASYAHHHWAYYDGTNAIEYRVPVAVQGMAYPHVYELIAGPPGMAIAQATWIAGNTAEQMLALGYGDVVWTPSAALSSAATVTVRVKSQSYATASPPVSGVDYVDVTWTVNTSSSTSQFIFIDVVNGNDTTGSGTFSAPWKTLNKVYGATFGPTSTYPGAALYLKAGTYPLYNQGNANAGPGIVLSGANNPITVLGIPGATVAFDITGCGGNAWVTYDDASDAFMQNVSFTGTPTAAPPVFNYFEESYTNNRLTLHNVSVPNAYGGTGVGNENSGLFFSNNPGGTTQRNYLLLKGVTEANRPLVSGYTNNDAICLIYRFANSIAEFCSATNNNGTGMICLKDGCVNWTRRYCISVLGSSAPAYGFFDLSQDSGVESSGIETCYCISDTSAASNKVPYILNQDAQGQGPSQSYRNTYVGYSVGVSSPTGNGPFSFTDDVIQYGAATQGVYSAGSGGSLPSNITNTGTECQASSGVVNATTYLLQSAYSSYQGGANARGHCIA